MRQWKGWLAAWVWCGLCAIGAVHAQAPGVPGTSDRLAPVALPAADLFFRPPEIPSARLSPSGRWMAASVVTDTGRYALLVFPVESGGGQPTIVARYRDVDIDRFHWVNDERLIYDIVDLGRGSADPDVQNALFSVRRDGSETRKLLRAFGDEWRVADRTLDPNHVLLRVPQDGGDEVVVGEWKFDRNGDREALVPKRLDVATGRVRSIAQGTPAGVTNWIFDAQGRPRVGLARRDGRTRVYWRAQAGDDSVTAWTELGNFSTLAMPWIPSNVDAAGQLYVKQGSGAGGTSVLKRFDFTAGRPEPAPLVATPGFDFTGEVITDPASGRFLGVRVETDAETTVWTDPAMQALQQAVDARLPGRVNRLHCQRCGQDDAAVLVFSWSDREPGEYWLWRGPAAAPTLWLRTGQTRRNVDAQRMASVDFHRYRARDGREIPLWLTTPASPAEGPRPAVVLVHGGPWVRGGRWAWDGMAQFLASRGYVVIAPEFRGSTGYGAAHFRAGWKQWGRAMQDDLADAVAWAAARGTVDAKRVCIAGASYGGYATLMGLVRHPETYRCGAAWVAVTEPALLFTSDWKSDVSAEARMHSLPAMLADPVAEAELLRDISPVAQAARLQAPLLLAYGELDRRVPLEHGKRLRAALQVAGREPEYVVYAGEGHRWQRAEHRIDFASRLERFLAQHLRPHSAAALPATPP